MSNRAAEYRGLIDDVVAGGLLEEDEWIEIRDLIARVQRKLAATMPAESIPDEAAE
jgi:hypothetical protein